MNWASVGDNSVEVWAIVWLVMTQNALKCVRFHNVRGLLLVARILHRTALASRDDLRNSAERSTTRVWMFFGGRRFVGYGLQPAILLVSSQKGESNESCTAGFRSE